MFAVRLIVLLAVTAATVLTSARPAAAQDPCALPGIQLSAVPDVVVGADAPVIVSPVEDITARSTVTGNYTLTMTNPGTGKAFFTDTQPAPPSTPNRYLLRLGDDEPSGLVTLTWQQTNFGDPLNPPATCTRTATVRRISGRRTRPRIDQSWLVIGGGRCHQLAPRDVRVRVLVSRPRQRTRTRTIRLTDPCGKWNRSRVTLPGVRVTARPADNFADEPSAARLEFEPTADERRFFVTVIIGRRIDQALIGETTYQRGATPRRIYLGTPDFFEDCIRADRQIRRAGDGRAFCERYDRAARFVTLQRFA